MLSRYEFFLMTVFTCYLIDFVNAQQSIVYRNVSLENLPVSGLANNSMDAKPADIDGDGDLDIVVACEFCRNIILLNDGTGNFTNATSIWLPNVVRDSEDIGIADFDNNGALDIIFVSEDDRTNEYYLNSGEAFSNVSTRLPVTGVSNAVLINDINTDGYPDIFIGNSGQSVILIGDKNGFFTNETQTRLPSNSNITQDLELGDIDGDGDLDLIEGNENGNRLLINLGTGVFVDSTDAKLPLPQAGEETREADLGDVDGDGDLDIFFANVTFGQGKPSQNRLLINDGKGSFTDSTLVRLPAEQKNTVDADFVDLNSDTYLDLVLANAFNGSFQLLLNDGSGSFQDHTLELLSPPATGIGIDVEAADFNDDGLLDLYFCVFQGQDQLYLAENIISVVPANQQQNISDFRLSQNYPNPFNPSTTITYSVTMASHVSLNVYNLLGKRARILVSRKQSPGEKSVLWDGRDDDGFSVPSGVYIYRIVMGEHIDSRKMIFIK